MVDCSYRAGGRACALAPSPSPRPPSAPTLRERKGEGNWQRGDAVPASVDDTAFTNQITPLPQCGRGAGGEGGPQRGSGASLPLLLDNSPTLWYCSTTLHLREGDISRTIELRHGQSCPAMHSGTDRRWINRLFGVPTVQVNAPAVGT